MVNLIKIRIILARCLESLLSVFEKISYFASTKPCIVLKVWAYFGVGKIYKHRNYGDDLNVFLFRELTSHKIFNAQLLPSSLPHVLGIGSIIHSHCTANSIVWGSGVMYPNVALPTKPLKVLAVRGKLTRDYFLRNGVDCPNVYGDPALLLPYVYNPCRNKKYKWGIIAHIQDESDSSLKRLQKKLSDYHMISFSNYRHWHDVINEMLECECILSSSLHGLIISDAYKIPNLWIEFTNPVGRSNFKYFDYFSSVNRMNEVAVRIGNVDIAILKEKICAYKSIIIDLKPLIKAAPFDIKQSVLEQIKI